MRKTATISPTLRVDALFALVAVAVTALAGAGVAGPRMLRSSESRADQMQSLENRRVESRELDAQTEGARTRLNALRKESDAAVQLLPASHINRRLAQVAVLAKARGLGITQLAPGTPPPSAAIAPPGAGTPGSGEAQHAASVPELRAMALPIKLAGSGTYPDVAAFLQSMRAVFRDTALVSLKMTAQQDGAGSEKTSAVFTIDLAWYAVPAGSADAPGKP